MVVEQTASVGTMADYLENNGISNTEKSGNGSIQVVDDVSAHYAGRSSKKDDETDKNAEIQESLDKFKEAATESKVISLDPEETNPLQAFMQTKEVEITDDFVKEGRKLLNKLRTDLDSYLPRQKNKAAVFQTESGKAALSQMFALISLNGDNNEDLESLQRSARTFINDVIIARTENKTDSYSSADPIVKGAVDKMLSSSLPKDQFKAVARIVANAEKDVLKLSNVKSKIYKQIANAYGGGELGKNIANMVHSKIVTLTSTMPSQQLDEALQDEDLSKSFGELRSNIASVYEEAVNNKIEKIKDPEVVSKAEERLEKMMAVYKADSIADSVEATKELVKLYAEDTSTLIRMDREAQAFKTVAKKLGNASRAKRPTPVVLESNVLKALSAETLRKLVDANLEQFKRTYDENAAKVDGPAAPEVKATEITNKEAAEYLKRFQEADAPIDITVGSENINIEGDKVTGVISGLSADRNAGWTHVRGGSGSTEPLLSAEALTAIKEELAKEKNAKRANTGEEIYKKIADGELTVDQVISEITGAGTADEKTNINIPELTVVASRSDTTASNIAEEVSRELNNVAKERRKEKSKFESVKRKVERQVFMPAAKSVPAISLGVGSSILNLMYNQDGLSTEMQEALEVASREILEAEKTKYSADANKALENTVYMQVEKQVDALAAPKLGSDVTDIDSLIKKLYGDSSDYTTGLLKLKDDLNRIAEESGSSSLAISGDDLALFNSEVPTEPGEAKFKKAKQYAIAMNKINAILASSRGKEAAKAKEILTEEIRKNMPVKKSIKDYYSELNRIENAKDSKLDNAKEARDRLDDLEGSDTIWQAADASDENGEALKNTAGNFFKDVIQAMLRATGLKSETFAEPIKTVREASGDNAEDEGILSYDRAVLNFLDSSMQAAA